MIPPRANWLASYPKSGNTWVRLLLNAYSIGACELNANVTATLSDTIKDQYYTVARYPLTELEPETVFYFRQAVLTNLLLSSVFTPVVIKTHSVNGTFGEIKLIPTAMTRSAVYLIRDPRDVVASFARHTGKSVDQMIVDMDTENFMLGADGAPIATWIGKWSDHVKSWEEKDYTTIFKYEDMKKDPASCFRAMLEIFGIEVEEDKLTSAVELTDIDRLKKLEEKTKFNEIGKQDKFFGQGKGWENELTEKQIRRIEEDHGEKMEKYGYKLAIL